jgi:sporulation protein YlmC with PRC-barrel domain
MNHRTISCDLLADNKVKDSAGHDIGRVEEIVMHPHTGAITHVVISFGGFLGASDRLFVAPWSALELDQRTRTFHLRVDRRTLRTAPKFSRHHRDALHDTYLSAVDAHYGQPLASTAA